MNYFLKKPQPIPLPSLKRNFVFFQIYHLRLGQVENMDMLPRSKKMTDQ